MTEQNVAAGTGAGRGLSANALKMIAMAAMLADHINKFFVPRDRVLLYTLLDAVGYTTAPLLFYFLVEGFHKTRNLKRYLCRIAAFAAVSYAPFIYATQGDWPNRTNYMSLNVLFTMLAGLCLMWARRRIESAPLRWAAMLLPFALTVTSDWSPRGLIFVLVFDYFYGNFQAQAFVYAMICLPGALSVISDPIYSLVFGMYAFDPGYYIRGFAALGYFIPILLLHRYNGEKGRGGRAATWGFYLFYPAHLLILGAVRAMLR